MAESVNEAIELVGTCSSLLLCFNTGPGILLTWLRRGSPGGWAVRTHYASKGRGFAGCRREKRSKGSGS